MLRLAVALLLIALLAGAFGFPLVSAASYEFARVLFFVFLVLAVLALLGAAMRSPPA